MANLHTQVQIGNLLKSVGATADEAKILAAIAMVESQTVYNGKVYADADKVGDQHLVTAKWGASYGLFQIRSLNADRGTGRTRDAIRLPDPTFNALSALEIKRTQGYTAWSVFLNGQYKAYLPDLFPPPANVHVVIAGDTLGKIAQLYGTTVAVLQQLNNLADPHRISVGQHIKLPGAVVPAPEPYVPPAFPAGLKPDSNNPSAVGLQRALKAAGYLDNSVAENANYGPRTKDAVAEFHDDSLAFKSAGVVKDVAIGPKGWEHLHRLAYEKHGA